MSELTPFLSEVASVISSHEVPLHQQVVIVPADRAAFNLKIRLQQLKNGSLILPRIMTINKWMDEQHPARLLNSEESILWLFRSMNESGFTERDKFRDFYKWGGHVLGDFNAVDRHLADPKEIFRNLRDIKDLEGWEVDEWSFSESELQKLQARFIDFWEDLPEIYAAFQEIQQKENIRTGAGMERDLATRAFSLQKEPFTWFVGFNAISRAEASLIDQFESEGSGKALWDYDSFYVSDSMHEAGHFLRRNSNWVDQVKLEERTYLSKQDRKFRIVQSLSDQSQCRLAASAILGLSEKERNSCAIVLADESVLPELLGQLPAIREGYNISSGLSIQQGLFWSLASLLMDLHLAAFGEGELWTDAEIARKVTDHPLFKELAGTSESIRHRGIVPLKALAALSTNSKRFFEPVTTAHHLIGILKDLSNKAQGSEDLVVRESAFVFRDDLQKLEDLISEFPFANDPAFVRKSMNRRIRNLSISLEGDRRKGVQIMGVLETRALDFDHVIFLSVNEGSLPGRQQMNSYIPADLKRYFGLTLPEEEQNIYAYNFYRLLQRSINAWIVFNGNQDNGLGGGEMSRYIRQILYEFDEFPNIQVNFQGESQPASNTSISPISIPKTDFVMDRLHQLAEKGISPSALSKYILCPTEFYYRYVLRISEEEEQEDALASNEFGTVVHDSLEALYTPALEKNGHLSEEYLTNALQQVPEVLLNAFDNIGVKPADLQSGKLSLNRFVAEEYVKRGLLSDMRVLKKGTGIRILDLERRFDHRITIHSDDRPIEILLKGKADRLDKTGNHIRIADYKTGKTEPNDLRYKAGDPIFEDPGQQKKLQLLWYAFIYLSHYKEEVPEVQSGIISLRNISEGFQPIRIAKAKTVDLSLLEEFDQELNSILRDIFNPHLPFDQNPDPKYDTLLTTW